MGFSKIETNKHKPKNEHTSSQEADNGLIAADATVTLDLRLTRRSFLTSLAVLSATLLAACSPDATPAASPPASSPPATETPQPQEKKKEATISLTATSVVPNCLLPGESAVIGVRIDIFGEGLSVNNGLIQIPLTVLRGDANSVTFKAGNNEEITISQTTGWAAPISLPYERIGVNGAKVTGIATMPPIPLLDFEGINKSNQFCFEAPQMPVNGLLA